MSLSSPPAVTAQMLIRKPAAEAYAAFVDPAITTRFWFTKSSGRLVPGAEVLWEWEMYGAAAPVRVKALEPDRRILVDWGDPPREVEWQFTARPDGTTLVIVSERGFQGSDDEMVAQAIDSQGGFSFVLAALKAFLEHGIELNLVADHQPDAQVGA